LHGNADRVVSLSRERQMVTVLKRVGAHYEEHILKNVDHAFGNVAEAELLTLITNFLKTEKFARHR
jgi:dipeptidyl aminopeptidase/acylaminoacyl peptidase